LFVESLRAKLEPIEIAATSRTALRHNIMLQGDLMRASPIPTPLMAAMLALLAIVLLFTALGAYELRGSTELRVAGIAAGAYIDNDLITPRLNGKPFLEKPPLSIWLDTVGIELFGITPLAVRLASALAGLCTALLVFAQLQRLQRPPATAWLAGLLLITMAQFWSNTRQVGEDALLTLGVAACLLGYMDAQIRRSLAGWLLFAAGLAVATLSKGMLGLALPGAAILGFLGATSLLDRRLVLLDWLRPAGFAAIGLIPLLVWLYFLHRSHGGGAVAEVLWSNSVGRFGGKFANNGHFEPFYYYLLKLPEIFLPWNILVFLGLWQLLKRARHDRYALLLCCWLIAPFVLLSLSSGKRAVYLLALYPAAAIVAAEYCRHLLELVGRKAATSPVADVLYRRHRALTAGLILLISAGYVYRAAIWEPRQDAKVSILPTMSELDRQLRAGRQVILYQPTERLAGAVVFYTGRTLPQLDQPAELHAFLEAAPHHIALTQPESAPPDLQVLHRQQIGKRGYVFLSD
jgi:4-amino-4-deoxy-L-arabinose transferase-like glycosyltransferase